MMWLILGVLLWSVVHLLPSLGRSFRATLIERLDTQKYQGLFALAIVSSVLLMVFGWRSTPPIPVYSTPAWGRMAAIVLMLPALMLFAASGFATNLTRVLRHPQLTGLAVWSFGHLLANGESRSLVLFGGLLAWSIIAMLAINRRDGARELPEPVPLSAELKPVFGGIIAYAALYFAHPWIAGVSPGPW